MAATTTAVAELEHALTIPPAHLDPIHRSNPISVAHAALEALRESGDEHFLFLRCVIQLQQQGLSPDKEELFFHAATGCRQVVLWQWKQYSSQFVKALREYFVELGHALSSLATASSRTCRLACYTTAVSFWKRGWNVVDGDHVALRPQEEVLLKEIASLPAPVLNDKNDLSRYLESIFQQSPEQAAVFCECLVGEFCGKSAIAYRMPLEFHKEAHRSFEKNALFPILTMSLASLGQAVSALSESAASPTLDGQQVVRTQAAVQLTMDVIGWEFGMAAWDTGAMAASSATRTLIRPPVEWRETLARPDFVRAIFHVHHIVASKQQSHSAAAALAHNLRQLLLLLASLSGPMFVRPEDRKEFASHLLEGTVKLLEQSVAAPAMEDTSDLLDTLQLMSRLIGNFRLSTLVDLPSLVPFLQRMTGVGNKLLADQVRDYKQAQGDVDGMEHREWREEALALLLDCAVLLCGDPWLLYSGTEESRKSAQASLSGVLRPLYEGFVHCRTRMASMEEHYLVSTDADLDEVQENIIETDLLEELSSLATVGRLNLSAAIGCLSNMFGHTMPQLQSLWEGSGEVTPQTAALLEESRLLTMYVCHLLTDDNEGETPAIPDAVVIACRENDTLAGEIASAVQALLQFADAQTRKIAQNPSNRRLSPILARSFLMFVHRWAPAYVYPTDLGASNAANKIFQEWSAPDRAQQVIDVCCSLCIHYQCYWPHEPQVQESAGNLLMALAKKEGPMRSSLVASTVFHQIVRFHCLTAGMRHIASHEEFEAALRAKVPGDALPSMGMVWGYQRLPYQDKARVLTSILVGCSDKKDEAANVMINDSLRAVHDAFTSLVHALTTKQVGPNDLNAKEMACLCVEMFGGVANAGEMLESTRIPQFVTPYLLQLSGLMAYYAKDLSICEALLRFFRDYTEQFVAIIDREQSLALFNASVELLKSYSTNHCQSRVIVQKKSTVEAEAEEEQAYNDILCAIQLLINLGAKDFIDACSTSGEGLESTQVTDMIFFGLQQILPLMTQGLLQFPTLCSQFFELVGFMMDTYPEKVCVLPYDLFDSLLGSLLFGMSHVDAKVSKCSLHGIAAIAKEHLSSQVLAPHLAQHPDIFDKISRRLLTEVVFQTVVTDRVEAAGMALLPLAAVDVHRFAAVVQQLVAQVPDERQRHRLQQAFTKLIQPEALQKVSQGGYEGRMNRARFKKDFEEFVNEVHSFLVLK